jgi:hypothetical protein
VATQLEDRPAAPDFLVCIQQVTSNRTGETGMFAFIPSVPDIGAWHIPAGTVEGALVDMARIRLASWIGVTVDRVRAHYGKPLPPAVPFRPGTQ